MRFLGVCAALALLLVLIAHYQRAKLRERSCPPVWECNGTPETNNPRCCP